MHRTASRVSPIVRCHVKIMISYFWHTDVPLQIRLGSQYRISVIGLHPADYSCQPRGYSVYVRCSPVLKTL
jgi:hypothetical protein